jgi:hypothetical protein
VIQEAYIHGISTRAVDDLVNAMSGSGVSKSQVTPLCEEIDERVNAFLSRSHEGNGPICGPMPSWEHLRGPMSDDNAELAQSQKPPMNMPNFFGFTEDPAAPSKRFSAFECPKRATLNRKMRHAWRKLVTDRNCDLHYDEAVLDS